MFGVDLQINENCCLVLCTRDIDRCRYLVRRTFRSMQKLKLKFPRMSELGKSKLCLTTLQQTPAELETVSQEHLNQEKRVRSRDCSKKRREKEKNDKSKIKCNTKQKNFL